MIDLHFNEPKKNIYLYIGIAVIIVTILIAIIGSCLFLGKKSNSNDTVLNSSDGRFSIVIPGNIQYKINSKENNEFVIDLFSEDDNMFMYASTIKKIHDVDLYDIAYNDKQNYLQNKQNIREDTGIVETKICNCNACEYNLVYTDSTYGKDFYCDVVWLETDNYIYILNFEVVNDNSDLYKDIFNNIKNSFKEL